MSIIQSGYYVPYRWAWGGWNDEFAEWSERVWKGLGIEREATRPQCGVTKWIEDTADREFIGSVQTVARLVAICFFTGETIIAELDPESGAITKWLARPKAWGKSQ